MHMHEYLMFWPTPIIAVTVFPCTNQTSQGFAMSTEEMRDRQQHWKECSILEGNNFSLHAHWQTSWSAFCTDKI